MNTDRRRMAEQIAGLGPMTGEGIRGALDWDFGRIRAAVTGTAAPWFVLSAAGWDLTVHGREELRDCRAE